MIKEKMKQLIGKSINKYNTQHVKDVVSELKFKEQYQGRIIDCMVGEVDDNYIETPETDSSIVKLEHSKEGLIKVHSIKGKTILVDADGNETDTPAEGCRLVSVGEEDNKLIFLSKNKNLFDGKIEIVEYPNKQRTVNFIKVKPNTNYISSQIFNTSGWTCVEEYDKNFNLIKDSNKGFSNGKFTTLENTYYIKLKWHTDYNLTNVMVVEGNVLPTEFIPYQSHKTEILLNEPLRSLPNGVCDEIIGNQLIRRIGKKVLDGSETWWKNWRYSDDKYSSICRSDFGQKNNTIVLSNILPNISYVDAYYSRVEGVGTYNNKGREYSFTLCFNKKDGYENASDILSDRPIEILYELAEPIIEELPNSITLQGFDDTTMYIENSITPTVTYGYNALIPYKEEVLNQQQEVETNTLDIEQNIIPYLMDMEFNLMLMEDE